MFSCSNTSCESNLALCLKCVSSFHESLSQLYVRCLARMCLRGIFVCWWWTTHRKYKNWKLYAFMKQKARKLSLHVLLSELFPSIFSSPFEHTLEKRQKQFNSCFCITVDEKNRKKFFAFVSRNFLKEIFMDKCESFNFWNKNTQWFYFNHF